KYLLEAMRVPFVPTHIYYDKESAKEWANNTNFPKVFKLRGGAGSKNVRLVNSRREALRIIDRAFNKGLSQFDPWGNLKERYRRFKIGKDSFLGLLKGVGRFMIPPEFSRMRGREIGYVYFQDFIPDNTYDIRV